MTQKQKTINTGKRFTTRDLLAQAVYTKELVEQDFLTLPVICSITVACCTMLFVTSMPLLLRFS